MEVLRTKEIEDIYIVRLFDIQYTFTSSAYPASSGPKQAMTIGWAFGV